MNHGGGDFRIQITATHGHRPNRHCKGKEVSVVSKAEIQRVADQIARAFHPERVILFGSYAYGAPEPDSDVDLLVLLPFEGKSFRKSLEILLRINPPFPVDLLARRPDDTLRRYAQGDPLIREALDKGVVLYERGHPQGLAGLIGAYSTSPAQRSAGTISAFHA
jgi:predicted nucleotidyltransferase